MKQVLGPGVFSLVLILASVFLGILGHAEDQVSETENPLQPFERLIGGAWHMEGSYSIYEWGLGQKSVHARSYAVSDTGEQLVSEGFWFWHPGEEAIRGYFTGAGMGVDLFDYTTVFRGDTMACDLTVYGAYGGDYYETWAFAGDDEYVWRLYQKTDGGLKEFMSSVYTRKETE